MHGTSAALPVIASLLRSRKVQVLAQTVQQRRPRVELQRTDLAIHLQSYRDCASGSGGLRRMFKHWRRWRGGCGERWRSCNRNAGGPELREE